MSREITYIRAVNEALHQILEHDERAFIIGEDIAEYGGAFQQTVGLLEAFGPRRVRDTPISEAAIAGLAVGAAAVGLRPIVDFVFADFMLLALDQVMNQAAKMRYMSGGSLSIPVVFRAAQGAGRSSAAQHSQTLHGLFAQFPGVKVVAPSNAYDAKGLLIAAMEDPDPVIVLDDKMEYGRKCHVPTEMYRVPLGSAAVVRSGSDATVIAFSSMVHAAVDAAAHLEESGVSVEVVDVRSLRPLDTETLVASAARTGRVVVVDESPLTYGPTGEIVARLNEAGFVSGGGRVVRLGALDVPVPFSPVLEGIISPNADRIVASIKELLA